MSHTPPLKADPGINQDIEIRKSRNASIVFSFLDADGVDYPITDDFRFVLKPMAEADDADAIMDITNADDLVISGNTITVPITEEDSNIDRPKCYYELINTTTGKNWFQGDVQIKKGKASEDIVTELSATVNLSGTTVSAEVTLADHDDSIPLSAFATELTFSRDQELSTVNDGGTVTFTLAASGHKNGVGIIARINEPVAVNFGADAEEQALFEEDPRSEGISTISFNHIIMVYKEDWDGAGNDKVVYTVTNFTAI